MLGHPVMLFFAPLFGLHHSWLLIAPALATVGLLLISHFYVPGSWPSTCYLTKDPEGQSKKAWASHLCDCGAITHLPGDDMTLRHLGSTLRQHGRWTDGGAGRGRSGGPGGLVVAGSEEGM